MIALLKEALTNQSVLALTRSTGAYILDFVPCDKRLRLFVLQEQEDGSSHHVAYIPCTMTDKKKIFSITLESTS